jgi:uncharacterized oxidoreductase
MPIFTADELRQVVHDMFSPLGASEEEIRRLQDHLVGANLAGHDSHGVRNAVTYVNLARKGHLIFGAKLDVVADTQTHAVLDGNWGLGQLMGWKAARMAASKAKNGTIAAVTLRNCSHLGRLGEYAELMAGEGVIGFLTVNGHGGAQCAAPHGGLDRRLSVNPFAYGIPGPNGPIVLDMSPTVVAGGKVAIKALRDEPAPVGWLVDSEGRPTTDPTIMGATPPGSLVPLGGHKGFGMAFVMDVLAGALTGGGCSKPSTDRWGNSTLFMAINPSAFVGTEAFDGEVAGLVDYVKSSRLAPGFDEILVPGEPEARERIRRGNDGIYLAERTWEGLQAILDELKTGES